MNVVKGEKGDRPSEEVRRWKGKDLLVLFILARGSLLSSSSLLGSSLLCLLFLCISLRLRLLLYWLRLNVWVDEHTTAILADDNLVVELDL